MNNKIAKFSIGQLVSHRLLQYRGVIVDVDGQCQQKKWNSMAQVMQSVDQGPWYRILVDDANHMTYVSEAELLADDTGVPIDHPFVEKLFEQKKDGAYKRRQTLN